MNLPHVRQVFLQYSLTLFFNFLLSAFLHFFDDLEFFNAHNFPSFELHLFFSLVQLNFNLLHCQFFDITDGKLSEQPIKKSNEYPIKKNH